MNIRLPKYFHDAARLYQRQLAPARTRFGLTQTELDILLFLANNPEYDTASDIVAVRRLAKSNLSVGIKALERKGYLCRQADGNDRRLEHLRLTDDASPVVALGRQCQRAFEQAAAGDLSSEERALLGRLLGRIHENMMRALDGQRTE